MRNLLLASTLCLSLAACKTMNTTEMAMEPCDARAYAVFFDLGSADVTDEAEADLMAISRAYEGCDSFKMEITGYADSVGADNPNLELSGDRAQNVFEALLERGVVPERAEIVSMGERTVLDTGEPDAFERRVVVTLLPEDD